MTTNTLLVELLVEELPPKALKKLGETFGRELRQGLVDRLLAAPDAPWQWFASPRRLAVQIDAVAARQAPRRISEKLMPVSVAFDAHEKPTQALLKKLQARGFRADDPSAFERRVDGKAETLYFQWTDPGLALAPLLQEVAEAALAKLPIPKLMSYQLADGWTSVNFVRPAHGLVALHGAEVVPIALLGLAAGRQTHGHRFEAVGDPVVLRDASSYADQLRDEGAVMASFAERRAEVLRQLNAAAPAEGLTALADDELLDEVTALVERPNVLLCRFESEFLEVPQECLILTMKANQKYFPLVDAAGKLTNRFLVVSNIRPADPGRVIGGNERVVRPRLADAKFFFDQDRKRTLASRLPGLAKTVYHNKLGSQGERSERVVALARAIAAQLGDATVAADAEQAARLAKADLLTDMVGEFPELQGIMGGYYARHDGLSDAVALAIEDHYRPRFAGDELPRNAAGVVVALADKLETLAGLFGIGQLPTGDKDPFALRRHALGVIRLLIERELPLELPALLRLAADAFAFKGGDPVGPLTSFIHERLAGYCRELGFSAQEIDAVLAQSPDRLAHVPARLRAVRDFARLPEAAALAAANKRIHNILKKSVVDSAAEARMEVDAQLLTEPAEKALHAAVAAVTPASDRLFEACDYTASLRALAALKEPVDAFFDDVMVNAEDPQLRANRLALLARLDAAMNRVADLSRLAA